MRSSLPVRRGLDVVAPITLYRAIGRRPSAVYVDDQRRVTRAQQGSRLWDLVFQEHQAQPGDQLQDLQGSMVLVSKSGACHRVQLSRPIARSAKTAFTHAQSISAADSDLIDSLLADGKLAVASIRRVKFPPASPAATKFDEDHPLVLAADAVAPRVAAAGEASP